MKNGHLDRDGVRNESETEMEMVLEMSYRDRDGVVLEMSYRDRDGGCVRNGIVLEIAVEAEMVLETGI